MPDIDIPEDRASQIERELRERGQTSTAGDNRTGVRSDTGSITGRPR